MRDIKLTYSEEVESIINQLSEEYNARLAFLSDKCSTDIAGSAVVVVSKCQHDLIINDHLLKAIQTEKARIISLAIPISIEIIK